MKPSAKSKKKPAKRQKANGDKSIAVTPMQLLAFMLKTVLKDRITDEEVDTICTMYYATVQEWWGEGE